MNHFKNKLHTGAIGSQKTFREDFNKVLEILENIEGLGGITIAKNGNMWRISVTGQLTASGGSGGIPDGYEEEELNYITSAGIKTRTVLVKTSTKADVVTPGSGNKRLVLQVTEPSTGTYAIGLDYVHLADEA